MERSYNMKKQIKGCPNTSCRKVAEECGLEYVFLPSILGDDSPESDVAPKKGAYSNSIVYYEANGAIYIYSREGIPTKVNTDGGEFEQALKEEEWARKAADQGLQNQINHIEVPDAWLKEDIEELPANPDQSTIYLQREAGVTPLYEWTYQNRTGFKFFKDEDDDLIATPTELNDVEWNITSQVGGFYLGSNNVQMYQQFGSGSKPYTELQLTSAEEWEDVESLFVFSAGGSHTGTKYMNCKVEIGDGADWTLIGEQDVGTLTGGYCNKLYYENSTNVKNGYIRLTFTQDANKAFYLNGISVNTVATVVPAYKIYTDGEWYTLNTTPEETIEAKIPADIAQTYTVDPDEEVSYTGGEIHLVNKDGQQIGTTQVVKWAASAGNTIYAKKAQYDVDDDALTSTYGTSLDFDGEYLSLINKDGDSISDVDMTPLNNFIIDLGVIDYADYDDDRDEFLNTLTQTGRYKYIDAGDQFDHYVEVTNLGNLAQQIYWSADDGATYVYVRSGYAQGSAVQYGAWDQLLTYTAANGMFAAKNHYHYVNTTTALSIRNYFDTASSLNGEIRITSTADQELYISNCYSIAYNPGGGFVSRRVQSYFALSQPWKTYSRYGVVNNGVVTWGDWYVVEGVQE